MASGSGPPVCEHAELTVGYLISSLDSKAIQCHLLIADTSTAAKDCECYLGLPGSLGFRLASFYGGRGGKRDGGSSVRPD